VPFLAQRLPGCEPGEILSTFLGTLTLVAKVNLPEIETYRLTGADSGLFRLTDAPSEN
jgi:hypothetical protein